MSIMMLKAKRRNVFFYWHARDLLQINIVGAFITDGKAVS